jgi:hypothetical protein
MGMDRSTLPSADPSTVWLTDLIEATEVVAASAEPCDPAIVKAFGDRLEMRADVRPPFDPAFAHHWSGPWKDLAMFRLLSILAFSALCILPDRASADQLKPHESLASEISSRQRCACTWRGPTRINHHRRYRSVRTAYLVGYDPLPYRFGSASVWAPPYRYYWR